MVDRTTRGIFCLYGDINPIVIKRGEERRTWYWDYGHLIYHQAPRHGIDYPQHPFPRAGQQPAQARAPVQAPAWQPAAAAAPTHAPPHQDGRPWTLWRQAEGHTAAVEAPPGLPQRAPVTAPHDARPAPPRRPRPVWPTTPGPSHATPRQGSQGPAGAARPTRAPGVPDRRSAVGTPPRGRPVGPRPTASRRDLNRLQDDWVPRPARPVATVPASVASSVATQASMPTLVPLDSRARG